MNRGKIADLHFRRVLLGLASDEHGQSTVEYAVVTVGFLALIAGIAAISGAFSDGMVVEHIFRAASHNAEVILGGAADVFSY